MQTEKRLIRKPAVAGTFYPSSPIELAKQIAEMFNKTEKVAVGGAPLALIAPHAGYPYSGATAAKAYKLLEGHQYDTVVIISPSHTVFFTGSSVYEGDGYETPLGVVEIDKELSAKIASLNPSVYLSSMGHASGSSRGEHALEVQLPFLQVALGQFRLVAIVMGDQDETTARSLGEVLATSLKGVNALVVASTDLSHFHPEKEARRLDNTVRLAVEKYDPDTLLEIIEDGSGEACGAGPMVATMIATKRLGGAHTKFLQYTTSGATSGDFDEVVGYLSAAIVGGKSEKPNRALIGQHAKKKEDQQLSRTQRMELHSIARQALAAHLNGEAHYPTTDDPDLREPKGAFVTITMRGELRGCIGQIRSNRPLFQTIAQMTIAAACEDPRFVPVTVHDYKKIEIEISVLSPLMRVHDISEIEVGRDGLMIKLDSRSGLLLPQVAVENKWDTTEFLEQTCLKAGLPMKAYTDKDVEIYRFTAEVF